MIMRAIQKYLPEPRHNEIRRIFVSAKPGEAWEVARHFDASAIKWVRLLFDIRTLPEKLTGKQHDQKDRRIGIDQITEDETGFMILHEIAGKEVVIGSVGQFWHLNIPFATVHPNDFKDFSEPGWGKLAWAITVEPYLGGSTISFELRTTATDENSWKKLRNYYQIIGIGSKAIRRSLMTHFETVLGKMELPDEDKIALPGDNIIPAAEYSYTHAKNIEAPRDIIWQYLMQLGCDRAGWYSIDLLDHSGVPSVDHLVKCWETRNIGDKLAATPDDTDGFFNVYAVNDENYFVIGGHGQKLGKDFKMSWSFVLQPIGEDATRLITRVRANMEPGLNSWLQGTLITPLIHGIMQHVQLKTLKRYAERDAMLRQSYISKIAY
jgi:hypothetical protein